MRRFLFFSFISFLLIGVSLKAQAVKINEVVAANTQYNDEDGDTPRLAGVTEFWIFQCLA